MNLELSSKICRPLSESPHTPQFCFCPIPDREQSFSIFKTGQGYFGGTIIEKSNNNKLMSALLTRDEYGNLIEDICILPTDSEVVPKRLSQDTVYIKTNCLKGKNYIHPGDVIDTKNGFGSGIVGKRKQSTSSVEYPIYNSLTIHNHEHKKMLMNTSSFISQAVDECLRHDEISQPILDQTCWLINVVLYIDDHRLLNTQVVREAIVNFCTDYKKLPKHCFIRQPINYIFDIVSIDGILTKSGKSISHIQTDFQGIHYQT